MQDAKIPLYHLDCRTYDDFLAGHHIDAINIPAAELFQRMHELPPRPVQFILYVDDASRQTAIDFLEDRQFTVTDVHHWDAQQQQTLLEQRALALGEATIIAWAANPLLYDYFQAVQTPCTGDALDLACGSGRDAVYLATLGYAVHAVDDSIDALTRCQNLAQQTGVNIHTHHINLEASGQDPLGDFASASIGLIHVARYLHRPLWPTIQRLLKPGGVLIYHTFMVGCEKTVIGRPKNPNFLLKPGELSQVFNNWEIHQDTIRILKDGRPVNDFIAIKPQ